LIVLGIDTSTGATAVALGAGEGDTEERRDDPPAGEHPGHATRLLPMVAELLTAAGAGWESIDRIAVGVGPGTFTGLRVGVATARGLAQSRSIPLVAVSSLAALAAEALTARVPVAPGGRGAAPSDVLAVIDARRGEVFAAAFERGDGAAPRALGAAQALAPEGIEALLERAARERAGGGGWLAVGDGALRYRELLEAAGVEIPVADSSLHRVRARAICAAGARSLPASRYEDVVPDYRRRPDAELALEIAARQGAQG
jgi:tRNA threonylcarbamoyladenosine biosynthesis protein TsaB